MANRSAPIQATVRAGRGGVAPRQATPHVPRPPWAPARPTGARPSQPANRTGLPDRLKAGVEALSDLAMDDVRVHRNSSEPAKLGAFAYAKGTDIHLGPGQEQHLPHEAWHVVQQKQGRVRPTTALSGTSINHDAGLEAEADRMGAQAAGASPAPTTRDRAGPAQASPRDGTGTVQRREIDIKGKGPIETRDFRLNELRALQKAHPEVADKIATAIENEEYKKTRTREPHHLSDNESEDDQPIYTPDDRSYYRALRQDEDAEVDGLKPPKDSDPNITARAHVTSGSKAQTKSRFISATHSKSVATAWSASSSKKFAKFSLPPTVEFHDLTTKKGEEDTGLTGTGLNAAKSSQEIIVKNDPSEEGIPPEYVQSVYSVEQVKISDYDLGKSTTAKSSFLRTRRKRKEPSKAYKITKIYDREKESAKRLQKARQVWDAVIQDTVEQTNAQYNDIDEFEPIDADDVGEFFGEHGAENPYALDYISNDEELQKYLVDIVEADDAFIGSMIQRWS